MSKILFYLLWGGAGVLILLILSVVTANIMWRKKVKTEVRRSAIQSRKKGSR